MDIHISRGIQQFGPYSLGEVNDFLKMRRLLPTDMAWHEGLASWIPLSNISGVAINGITPSPVSPPPFPQDELFLRKIYDYERISGGIWIGFGIIQIICLITIIAGIWNIFAGISRIKMAPRILERSQDIPGEYEGIASLIVIGVINVAVGGVIGILFVAFDFYIRKLVLDNRHLFNIPSTETVASK